ncbi:MAG: hypothetical protein ACHQQ3_12285 [Gemmatimonadales bacterium]
MRPTPDTVRTVQSRPRPAHFVLMDGVEIAGGLYLNDGQVLAPYLGSRKGGWVNVVNAKWLKEDRVLGHAVLQANQILMAWSPGGEIPVAGPIAGSAPREVEVLLVDGSQWRGVLHLGDRQRMSDFLFNCGQFLPLLEAKRAPEGGVVGDVALNSAEVRLVRDTKVFTPSALSSAVAEDRGTTPAGTTTVTRLGLRTPTGTQTPPGARTPSGPQTPVGGTSTVRRQPRLSGHWLVQLATKSALEKPDAKAVEGDLSVQSVWRALAEKNDMADGELAAHVAASFHLPIANLDAASPEALAIVPEAVARALGVLPLRVENRQLFLAVSDPSETEIIRQIVPLTRLRLEYEIATPRDIQGAIAWFYAPGAQKPG